MSKKLNNSLRNKKKQQLFFKNESLNHSLKLFVQKHWLNQEPEMNEKNSVNNNTPAILWLAGLILHGE